MCLAVYIASDKSLEKAKPADHETGLYRGKLGKEDLHLKDKTKLPFVYHVGTFSTCSCGFIKRGFSGEALDLTNRLYREFAAYIRRAFQKKQKVELYTEWRGEVDDYTEREVTIKLSDLEREDFELAKWVHYRIRK